MNLPDAIRTARWMVRDTFRQSVATRLFWVMLAVAGVAVAVCLSVDVSAVPTAPWQPGEIPAVLPKPHVYEVGWEKLKADKQAAGELPPAGAPDPQRLRDRAYQRGEAEAKISGARIVDGDLGLAFGAIRVPVGRDREDAVRMLSLWLVAAVADTGGVLLALLWTAGFLPTFLEPQAATVLLAKPAPRWAVLLGKYAGVVLFVGLYATLFVGGTWLALGVKTGVWYAAYWLAVPLLVLNFGVFYAASAFLAVWTRSTVACAFGVLLFWFVCYAMNYTHHRLVAAPVDGLAVGSTFLLDVGYWFLPKPLDLAGVFYDAMRAEGFAAKPEELRAVQEKGQFHPWLSVASSAAFAAATLGLAAYEFEQTDY